MSEQEILDQLDDDLFLNRLQKDQIREIASFEPITEVDIVVGSAINRALRLSIPDGISGTMLKRN